MDLDSKPWAMVASLFDATARVLFTVPLSYIALVLWITYFTFS